MSIKSEKEEINMKSTVNPPPEKFSFVPAEWEKWRNRFSRYMSVSGAENKDDKCKIDCLLYCMGERSKEIILQFEENSKKTYENTLQNFNGFFIPKKNVIYERYKFNSRNQIIGETVDNYVTELYKLAENCEYGTLKEELIRDRIFIGVADKKISERMQLKEGLKLKDAITMCRQAEVQKEESNLMEKRASSEFEVNRIISKQACWFCGGSRHPKEKCPAVKAKCYKCGRVGHFATLCRYKSVKLTST